MPAFDLDDFTLRLIAETLFYDEEYGALGNLSLIDRTAARERFIASYVPEDGVFVVEEATEWETYVPDEDDDIGYALAVDSNEYGTYDSPTEVARVLLDLARTHGLTPSITLLFEEDEAA
ncbi:hypothetical protein GQ464_013220 [Rhodocaloribacter litoris]|uniref:hypothetical protein n=1 Tax=Rhodocaloribacter litoris TaxID=2558931 RepID=UPI001422C49B|nr:hypothetical protein [Rhodocaloribacter litoris]QXD14393.1 hypothetical protein GQ464_013220 [Rhodocaloribacter litoris]GIV61005.1 MAG: hypothetical protein KatS3mg043_2094 [Rhodothermaceae bacterium]